MSDEVKDQTAQEQEMVYNQTQRRKILDRITDKAIDNEDPEMLKIALKALDDSDKSSLGILKLNQKDRDSQKNSDNTEVLAAALIHASDRRAARGRPEIQSSSVGNTRLPADRKPKYDSSMRDATPGNENTDAFKRRLGADKG